VLETKRGPGRLFGEVLKSQLQEAIGLYNAFHDPQKKLRDYDPWVRAIEREVSYHLRPRALKDRDNQRLLNEIGRHHQRGNLLRFLHEPTTVEPTNNAAEVRFVDPKPNQKQVWGMGPELRKGNDLWLENLILV